MSHLSYGPPLHTSIPNQGAVRAHASFLKNHLNGPRAVEPCGKRLVNTVRRGYFLFENNEKPTTGASGPRLPLHDEEIHR